MRLRLGMVLVLLSGAVALATQKEVSVHFARGATSASYHGSVRSSESKHVGEQHDMYTLGASAGQMMTVEVTATGPVRVSVWKDDYNRGYICDSMGDRKVNLRVMLPTKGDYKVNVDRGMEDAEIDYDVKFSIR